MLYSKGQKVFNACNAALMVILLLVFALPYLLILATSLTAENILMVYGPSLLVRQWSFEAYDYILFTQTSFIRSFGVSVYITVVTAVLNLAVNALFAYPLSRRRFSAAKVFSVLAVITMLFGGGTIPFFLLIERLHLLNNLWALILPMVFSAYNIILLRNFFTSIPDALEESAKIDGANNFVVLFRIYLPLSKAVLATVLLFAAVNQWNTWTTTMMFIDSNHAELYPVQYYIRQLLSGLDSMAGEVGSGSVANLPQEGIKNAAIIVATLPIICVYPFLQKYFINGIMIGSVKE